MVTMFRHFIRNGTIVEQEATHGFVTPNWWVYPPYSLWGHLAAGAVLPLHLVKIFDQDRGRIVR